jgi:cytochrome P450
MYMQVIKEALRMYPVASGSLMRVADADMQLGDYHVPKGTHIQVWLSRTPSIKI